MIYENSEDRARQAECVREINSAWSPDVELIETPEEERLHHDFTMYDEEGSYCGSGEIKCRNYSASYLLGKGWLFEVERLDYLYDWFGPGVPVLLVVYTSDNVALYVELMDVLDALPDLTKAPASWMRDNHGKQSADKHGIIIPGKMLRSL